MLSLVIRGVHVVRDSGFRAAGRGSDESPNPISGKRMVVRRRLTRVGYRRATGVEDDHLGHIRVSGSRIFKVTTEAPSGTIFTKIVLITNQTRLNRPLINAA